MISVKTASSDFPQMSHEVHDICELFEFFLLERSLKKPVEALSMIVKDMRIVLQKILNGFLDLQAPDGEKFTKMFASELAKRCHKIPTEKDEDGSYYKYCIEQILVPFEWAAEIKLAYSDSPEMQKMLAADIPLLRPFDYGLQGKIRILRTQRKS